jgi:parallel beta-helix repeat protein
VQIIYGGRRVKERGIAPLIIVAIVVVASVGIYVATRGGGGGENQPSGGGTYSRGPIHIQSNDQFTSANGVTGGSGTQSDPYIIQGWSIDASSANGIDIRNTTAYFVVRNCLVENGGGTCYGIYLDNVIYGRIENDTCEHSRDGIYLSRSSYDTLINNNTVFNSDGIILIDSSFYNNLINNVCKCNSSQGILLSFASKNNLINNYLTNNGDDGIEFSHAYNNTIENNTCENNAYGIYLDLSSNNTFIFNYLLNNRVNNAYDDGTNNWDNDGKGNYWSDWQAPDVNNDGIVDSPRLIDGGSDQDIYPLAIAAVPGGSGTLDDPYIITTVEELQAMKNNLTAYYALGNDIDASATVGWNGGAGFAPIGTDANRFTGSFDGQGYKVNNLYINRPSTWYVGLFGYVGSGGKVENVGMTNESLTGFYCLGGLIGANWGEVTNCYSTGTINGGNDSDDVGGLIGWNKGTASKCYSTCSMNGSSMGGLVGINGGTITNCYATGPVNSTDYAGGLVELNNGTVSNSYSTGAVSGMYGDMGGLIGTDYFGSVSNSFWDNETSGQSTSGGGTGKTTENMKNVRTFTDNTWSARLTSPWDFVGNPYYDNNNLNIWNISSTINNGYPFLASFS